MIAVTKAPQAPGWRTPGGSVYLRCPYCELLHLHGVGDEQPGQSAGYRVPHCIKPPWRPDYEIIVEGEATPEIVREYRRRNIWSRGRGRR